MARKSGLLGAARTFFMFENKPEQDLPVFPIKRNRLMHINDIKKEGAEIEIGAGTLHRVSTSTVRIRP